MHMQHLSEALHLDVLPLLMNKPHLCRSPHCLLWHLSGTHRVSQAGSHFREVPQCLPVDDQMNCVSEAEIAPVTIATFQVMSSLSADGLTDFVWFVDQMTISLVLVLTVEKMIHRPAHIVTQLLQLRLPVLIVG